MKNGLVILLALIALSGVALPASGSCTEAQREEANELLDRGRELREDDPYAAIAFLEEALSIYESCGDHEGQADCLCVLGLCYQVMEATGENLRRAAAYHELAVEHYAAIGELDGQARSHIELQYVYSGLGDVVGAASQLEQALALYEAAGEGGLEWDVMRDLAGYYVQLARWEDAVAAYESVLGMYVSAEQRADMTRRLATCYMEINRWQEAIDLLGQVVAEYRLLGMIREQAECLVEMGTLHRGRNNDEAAKTCFSQAIDLFHRVRARSDETNALMQLGLLHSALCEYTEAMPLFEQAIETAQAIDDRRSAALAWYRLGICYYHLGDYQQCIDSIEYAASAAESGGFKAVQGVALGEMAGCYFALGDYERAVDLFLESERVMHGIQDPTTRVAWYGDFISGWYHELMGEYDEAIVAYSSALSIARLRDAASDTVATLAELGLCSVSLGQHEAGLAYLEEALTMASDMEYAWYEWWLLWWLGKAQVGLGELEAAELLFGDAVSRVEQIRSGIEAEELRQSFLDSTAGLYEDYVRLLYEIGRGIAGLPIAERCRARTFLDLVAGGPADVLDNIGEYGIRAGVVDADVIESDLAETIASLPVGTVALEYFVTDDAVYVWVISQDEIADPIQLSVDRTTLMNQVISCRFAIESQNPAADFYLAALYETLVVPIEDLLRASDCGDAVSHLLIIPSGPLYYLPFQALVSVSGDRQHHTRLIERYAVSYAPSLATLNYVQQAATATDSAALVAFADPDSGDPVLARLPDAQTESLRVASLFANAEVYVDSNATETVVSNRSSFATDVLFSTHGAFNAINPMYSYLLLSPDDDSDGHLYTYEVFSIPLSANLVTLSACETLLPAIAELEDQVRAVREAPDGEEVALSSEQLEALTMGDEISGLTRAFLYAGTSAVLSSLWSVYSQATADLMVAFYEGIHAGSSKAEALRDAQLQILNTPGYEHPVYWAAFNLMGDWR